MSEDANSVSSGISSPPSLGTASLSGQLGDAASRVLSQVQSSISGASNPKQPWEKSSVTSAFFKSIKIDGSRWDQLFPYRLLVIDAFNQNNVVNGDTAYDLKIGVTPGTSTPLLTYDAFGSQWVFQLPITPKQLTIQDQFAINGSFTLKGYMEEHSGARFKMITAAGTMGVWPQRPNVVAPPTSPSILESVFGGTISAAQNLVGQVSGLVNTIKTGHPASAIVADRPDTDTNSGYGGTGWYQAQALQQFLEQYAEAKRNPDNAGWRLVFHIPKQNTAYVVTPLPFVWNQTEANPFAVNYTLQFKAWRRIDLAENLFNLESTVQPISPGIMAKILNSISQARNVLSSATNLIGAVRSDVDAPLNALRQTALFVKQLGGVIATAADLPFQLQKDLKSSVADVLSANLDIKQQLTDPDAIKAYNAISGQKQANEGLSSSAVAGGQLGTASAQYNSIDPANSVLDNPQSSFSLIDQVPVTNMTLTPAQQSTIDTVLSDARETTVDDLKTMRGVVQQLATQLSNNFGAGDSFYSQVYGQPAPTARIQPMTLDEYDILKSLYDVLSAYDILTATQQVDFFNKQTNMDYVAGLAADSNILFNTSVSKLLVPVPFGLSVEAIALRYLGDPQRWLEIVTLNNLRDPYIDEDGFQISLLSNATGRQITIGSITNLYVGQRVLLQSSTQSPTARQILNIDALSATSFLITLDGLANLDNYTIADLAYLQAYLPGTVNSQQKIFIPSNLPAQDSGIVPPPVAASDPLTGLSKVDLLLTDDGDIAVNNFGDFRLSYGLTNVIQAIKLKVGSIRGTLLTHPDFGLGVKVGIINSQLTAQDVFDNLNRMLKADSRFQGLDKLEVTINGPTLAINMSVRLAGQQGVFPINFNVSA